MHVNTQGVLLRRFPSTGDDTRPAATGILLGQGGVENGKYPSSGTSPGSHYPVGVIPDPEREVGIPFLVYSRIMGL